MGVQADSILININKGEGRILMIPVIGYKDADWFVNMPDTEGCLAVGRAVLDAVAFVKQNSRIAGKTQKRDAVAAWQKNTKYKSWVSFWKHNHYGMVEALRDGQYNICSFKKSEERQGLYTECIKDLYLPPDASAEEIGQAVIDVLEASEEYYQDRKPSEAWRKQSLELPDGGTLKFTYPNDSHFQDCGDWGVAEIYQCYEYQAREGAESSADFFLGMAAELELSLEKENVASAWERLHGRADSFEMKETSHGIYKFRVEMRNKDCHKVSYFVQTSENMLLECSMEVHQPDRRKKLDEKMGLLFEEFALGCHF